MKIRINNLELPTIIGVHAWEKKRKNTLLVNIELELKNNKAAKTDNLADTIDYDSLTQKLHAQAVKLNYDLVEKFASHMLAIILQDKKIKAAKIEVTKSKISKIFENVCVTLEAKNK